MINTKTMAELREFISTAQPNTEIKYHTGYNLEGDSLYAFKIGQYMYDQSALGFVYLVRRRNFPDIQQFDYLAIKASPRPKRALIPISDQEFKKRYKIAGGGDQKYVRKRAANEQVQSAHKKQRKEERQRERTLSPVAGSPGLSTNQIESHGNGSL